MSSIRSVSLGLTAAAAFVAAAGAQPVQSLKDAWLATDTQLLALEEAQLVGKDVDLTNPPPRVFKALAFERPALGTTVLEVRGLIAVDDTEVWRFETNTPDVAPRLLFDAANSAPALRYVTALAVTDDDRIVISGYSRPKRVFEIWEVEIPPSGPPIFRPGMSSTPQITDAVYVRPEDVSGGVLTGGGLLATAGKQVLFFRKGSDPNRNFTTAPVVLADARSLILKGSTDLTSVDLVKRTGMLMIATTERTLLTRPANLPRETIFANTFAAVGLPSAPVPVSNCRTLRSQRLVVRNVTGGEDTSTLVADSACQQLVRYDVTDDQLALANNTADGNATWASPLVALAVGEGNTVTCDPSQSPNGSCELISGGAFTARINTSETSQLLVLQFPELCDQRVNPACAVVGAVTSNGSLRLNLLLPPALQAALAETDVTIPPYMFSARGDGHFGVVFVQADEAGDDAGATIELDIQKLVDPSLTGPDYELGVAVNLPRLSVADPIRVLNQDIAAYAPDNLSAPTVRDFEATPITI